MRVTQLSANTLLHVSDLHIRLPSGGDRPYAVEQVSFSVNMGEILCIVGESGSGKSIASNAIMGLLPSSMHIESGRIVFQGEQLLAYSQEQLQQLRGRDIAMIFQEPLSALNPLMTVGAQIAEVIQVHARRTRAAVGARVLELLALVGLPEPQTLQHAYPFTLSGGQRQRVVIAMALALEPALLIADEPTTALDVTTQAQILKLIGEIQKKMGMGIIFITHDFGVVAEIADRVVVMEKGRIVEQGAAQQILNHARHPYTRSLIASVPSGRSQYAQSLPKNAPVSLEVKHLRKCYRERWSWKRRHKNAAVDNVSFVVRRGETLGIVGESGSGKSTIGKCLLRLTESDSGEIVFDGVDIARLSQAKLQPLRKHIQMIFQDPFASLNPRHTVGHIISAGPVANGVSLQQANHRARELLELVGLDANAFDRYPEQFSGGQRQRIGIARALAMEPQVLVADECVSALDVTAQAQVLKLLQRLQQQLNIALIFITHDLRVAAQVSHRIAVMHKGQIVETGPPEQILDFPQHHYTQKLIASIPGTHWAPALTRDQWGWAELKWAI